MFRNHYGNLLTMVQQQFDKAYSSVHNGEEEEGVQLISLSEEGVSVFIVQSKVVPTIPQYWGGGGTVP